METRQDNPPEAPVVEHSYQRTDAPAVEPSPRTTEPPATEVSPGRRRPFAVVLLRVLRRHPLVLLAPLALTTLIVVGMIAGVSLPLPKAPGSTRAEVLGAQTAGGAPLMAVQSMEAMRSLNAQAFWTALDEQMKESLAAQGIDGPQGVEHMFTQIRSSGNAIKSYQFIARYDARDGQTVSFFMADRLGPQGREEEVPFLVTTNKHGLVSRLD